MSTDFLPITNMPDGRHNSGTHLASGLFLLFCLIVGGLIISQYSDDYLPFSSAMVNKVISDQHLDDLRDNGIARIEVRSLNNDNQIYRVPSTATLQVIHEDNGQMVESNTTVLHESDNSLSLSVIGDQVLYRSNRTDKKQVEHEALASLYVQMATDIVRGQHRQVTKADPAPVTNFLGANQSAQ